MIRLDKATYLSHHFKFILAERLSNSLPGSDVLLFLEFINILPILLYNFIEFITLLYIFLVISFARYRNILFDRFHLVSFQMCYLLLFMQELLVISESLV